MTILWPVDNPQITGEFGNSPDFYAKYGQLGHNGIDLGVPVGTPVYACDAGLVVAEGWGSADSWMGTIAGIYVRLQHWWGFSAVAHLNSTLVNVGQYVERGQHVAYSGATGVGTGPHAHFETFPLSPNFGNGYAGRVNPWQFGIEHRSAPQPAQPTKPKEKPVKISNTVAKRTKKQAIKANTETRVAFNDAGDVSLVFGPFKPTTIASVRVKGNPGARLQVNLRRDKAEGNKISQSVKVTGARAVFDELGLAEVTIGGSVDLAAGWRLRVTVQTSAGSGTALIEDLRWSTRED